MCLHMCVLCFLVKQGGLWRTYDSGSVGSSRGSSATGREVRERRGRYWGGEGVNMQGKISWDSHALLNPKPPKATTFHQQHHSHKQQCVCVCTWWVLPGNPRRQRRRHTGRSWWDQRHSTRVGVVTRRRSRSWRHRRYSKSRRGVEGRWRTRRGPPYSWGSAGRGRCCWGRAGCWWRTDKQGQCALGQELYLKIKFLKSKIHFYLQWSLD